MAKATAAAARGQAGRRKSRTDWLEAGLGLLANGEIAAVRIGPLCEALGVTTGSFYHHFDGRDDFLEAMIDHWCERQVEETIERVEAGGASPLERARDLERVALELGIGPQDQAMRAWARHDERARKAVRKADRRILGLLERVLVELGMEKAEAGLMARVLFFAGIGSYAAEHLLRPHRRSDVSAAVLALVTDRVKERRR